MPPVDRFRNHNRGLVALLFIGSAILLMSCKEKLQSQEAADSSDMMTQESENLTIVYSKVGNLSYRFTTPLMERYDQAKEPYMEFRKGVNIVTFNDSTQLEESSLTANYAIRYEKQELWEAKGNVIANNATGQQLETEQLFWDQRAKRIYSNVDSKVTQKNGDVVFGDGFESDEAFKEWVIRKPKGKVAVNVEPTDEKSAAENSAAQDSLKQTPPTKPEVKSESEHPVIREGESIARPLPSKKERKATPMKQEVPKQMIEN